MTRSFTEINQAIAWQLNESIGEDRFDMWFGSLDAIAVSHGNVVISVADDLSLSFVRQQFESTVREAVLAVLGTATSIQFQVVKAAPPIVKQNSLFSDEQLSDVGIETPATAQQKSKATRRRRRTDASAASPEPAHVRMANGQVLDSFRFGTKNLLLETAIKELFADPGKFNPLVMHGPTGCGKTHLATAIVAEARKTRRYRRCVNVTAEQFTTSFIEGLQSRRLTDFRSKFRNLDLLAIDDIQFFAGKQATVIEFQNTIEALLRNGKQIVVTSDRPVGELRFADDSLFNRLSSGLSCPVRYPDLQGRIEIVRKLAAQRNLQLPVSVQKMVAQRISRDVRLLSGAVNRLKAAAMVLEGPIEVEIANEYLGDLFHSQCPMVSLERIEKAVCEVCGVDSIELKGNKRIKRISTARMLAMWLSRKYTSAGLAEIGKHYGGRSHSTVVAAEKKINGLLDTDASIDTNARQIKLSMALGRLKNALDVG